MAGSDPGDLYSPEPNLLERKAAEFVAHGRNGGEGSGTNPREACKHSVRRIQRRLIALAVTAGVISGGLIGGSEIFVRQNLLGGMEDHIGFQEQLPYWAGFVIFAGILSAIEILFLYAIALDAARRVYGLAGGAPDAHYAQLLECGLARAALEFPNPGTEVYGIDPYARVPRWRLLAIEAFYRLKVGISSFLLRLFARRILGRLLVRGFVPLLSGPLYAVWNAFICWRILHELRLRAFGPAAVESLMSRIADARDKLDPDTKQIILEGAGEMMMRSQDGHPNYVFLLSRLRTIFGVDAESIKVDWDARREGLRNIDQDQRGPVLALLSLAAILGSRVTREQDDQLRETYENAGLRFDEARLKTLRSSLLDGAFDIADLLDLASVETRDHRREGKRRGAAAGDLPSGRRHISITQRL